MSVERRKEEAKLAAKLAAEAKKNAPVEDLDDVEDEDEDF